MRFGEGTRFRFISNEDISFSTLGGLVVRGIQDLGRHKVTGVLESLDDLWVVGRVPEGGDFLHDDDGGLEGNGRLCELEREVVQLAVLPCVAGIVGDGKTLARRTSDDDVGTEAAQVGKKRRWKRISSEVGADGCGRRKVLVEGLEGRLVDVDAGRDVEAGFPEAAGEAAGAAEEVDDAWACH